MQESRFCGDSCCSLDGLTFQRLALLEQDSLTASNGKAAPADEARDGVYPDRGS